MTLSEMREILKARDLQLTKSLGQNFLHDGNQLRRIVAAAELAPTDKVLEIGPGLGPLTESLLTSGAQVLAIEKDARLVAFLRERLTHLPNFTLLQGDALQFLQQETVPPELAGAPDMATPAGQADWSAWKLVANLPYSVASPILVELALHPRRPERMVTTLQLEVAQRVAARPDTEHYGVLTLLLQLHYTSHGYFKIPSGCFFPAPDVDSACLTLVRRPQPLLDEPETKRFVALIKRAFSQRRKMMLKLLKNDWPADRLEAAFAKLGISPQERAEKVGLEVFTEFCKLLAE